MTKTKESTPTTTKAIGKTTGKTTSKTTAKAIVYVRFKDEVLDPEGVTIQKSLAVMGYDRALSVRAGKFYEIELADDSPESEKQLKELSEKALANPVIEKFEIEWPAKNKS